MNEASTSLKSLLDAKPSKKDFGMAIRAEEESDYKAFAFGRVSIRPQLMLEFSKCDGYHLVLPYMDLKSISTPDPSIGFVLEFTARKITIEGSNLTECFRYLRENRVSILVEADRPFAMKATNQDAVISRIAIGKALPS